MQPRHNRSLSKTRSFLNDLLTGPQNLAFLPAFVLAGFWIGGEFLLLVMACGFPLVLAVTAIHRSANEQGSEARTFPTRRSEFEDRLSRALRTAKSKDRKTACLVIEFDDVDKMTARHGIAVATTVMDRARNRLESALRNRDEVFQLDEKTIGVCVAPAGHIDIDVCLQLATRLQAAAEQPLKLGALTIHISVSIGFCQGEYIGNGGGEELVEAAMRALSEARHNGPSGIRAFSHDMGQVRPRTRRASNSIERAFETGEIQAWFQPQVSTDTGLITGFEALARWVHPERGTIAPADFLPDIQQAGRMEQLGSVILSDALSALQTWDSLELALPHVGVNFSPDELRNPRFVEKIEWELDRFNLTPDRLAVEVLETVVATSPDDTVSRNINKLSQMGCFIDLDDFGMGHASISSIRRFAIQRLKIDRSFVTKVDQDAEQQRMVSAILLMAERLDLDTIAEGVETAGEHTMLAQLGCGHVQGYGIGKPMPFEQTHEWMLEHLAKLSAPPKIGRQTG